MSRVFCARSSNTAVALSTTYALITIGTVGDAVPDRCELGLLTISVDTIASSAASLTFKATYDAAGDVAATGEITRTIVTGQTANTDGSVVVDFAGAPWEVALTPSGATGAAVTAGVSGRVHLWVKTNTGTCNGIAMLTGKRA